MQAFRGMVFVWAVVLGTASSLLAAASGGVRATGFDVSAERRFGRRLEIGMAIDF